MAYDLAMLTYTPDIRSVPPIHARLVCAIRYTHVSRKADSYSHANLAQYLGSKCAVRSFHVFMDEVGRAWPDPIALHSPCQPEFSYDEMLLVDLATAAARNERDRFDRFARDMISESGRNAIWQAARRMMRHLVSVVR